MQQPPRTELTPAEQRDLRRLAGIMIPASAEYRVPGADDELIFADIVRSLGRDEPDIHKALEMLHAAAGGAFADLPADRAEMVAMAFLNRQDALMATLGRVVLASYYRDDRVMRAIGREPRAPFPRGHETAQGDWSLLDKVRSRPRMWRDVDQASRG